MSGLLSYFRDEAAGDARNFLQGASNSAASTISAPVDGMAWLMRKMGIPVPAAPVGGSDWMAQRGLTAAAPGKAGLLGETAGMVLPIVAQAKAPQIAKGLLTVEANAAKPSPAMWDQKGAIVWHGSPHQFNKFDSSKIGSGEGSQAYGFGHYVAESPSVARTYASMAKRPGQRSAFGVSGDGRAQAVIDAQIKLGAKQYAAGDVSKFVELVKERPRAFANPEALIARAAEYVDNAPPSYVYKIDLPDDQIAKMIDLEAQVPEQLRGRLSKQALSDFGSGISLGDGRALLKEIESSFKLSGSRTPAKDAAEWLRRNGVPGLTFKDAGTRHLPDGGTSNFVVFPGEEGLLQILERNGAAL